MKLRRNKFYFFSIILCICFLLNGCGSSGDQETKKAKDYKNSAETFQISIEGQWTKSSNKAEDTILLDSKAKTLTILVRQFPKDTVDAKDIDGFINLYHTNAIAELVSMSEEPTIEELVIDGMINAKAEEFTATKNLNTAKAYVAYLESESNYYAYVITGLEKIYNEDIASIKPSISKLKELSK